MSEIIIDQGYVNDINILKKRTQSKIIEIERCEGFGWEEYTQDIDAYGMYVRHVSKICKHLDYRNGCRCMLDRNKRPCYEFIKVNEREIKQRKHCFPIVRGEKITKKLSTIIPCQYREIDIKYDFRMRPYLRNLSRE